MKIIVLIQFGVLPILNMDCFKKCFIVVTVLGIPAWRWEPQESIRIQKHVVVFRNFSSCVQHLRSYWRLHGWFRTAPRPIWAHPIEDGSSGTRSRTPESDQKSYKCYRILLLKSCSYNFSFRLFIEVNEKWYTATVSIYFCVGLNWFQGNEYPS